MPQRSQDGRLVVEAVVKRVGRCFGAGARIARVTLSPVYMLLFWCVTCLSAVQGFDLSFGVSEIVGSRGHGTTRDLYAGYNVPQVSAFPPQGAQTIESTLPTFGTCLLAVPKPNFVLPGLFDSCLSRYPCATSLPESVLKIHSPPGSPLRASTAEVIQVPTTKSGISDDSESKFHPFENPKFNLHQKRFYRRKLPYHLVQRCYRRVGNRPWCKIKFQRFGSTWDPIVVVSDWAYSQWEAAK